MSFKVTDFGTNRKLICDFLLVINTNLLPPPFCTVSKLWPIIGQIFASDRGCQCQSEIFSMAKIAKLLHRPQGLIPAVLTGTYKVWYQQYLQLNDRKNEVMQRCIDCIVLHCNTFSVWLPANIRINFTSPKN